MDVKVAAYFFYGLAVVALVVVILAAVSLGNEYGWDLAGVLWTILIGAVVAGLPLWIGSLFHRRARRGTWTG